METPYMCPHCGYGEEFEIDCIVPTKVNAEGNVVEHSYVTWEDDTPFRCPRCEHEGVVADLTMPSKDSMLQVLYGVHEYAALGLNSSEPAHHLAALNDIMAALKGNHTVYRILQPEG